MLQLQNVIVHIRIIPTLWITIICIFHFLRPVHFPWTAGKKIKKKKLLVCFSFSFNFQQQHQHVHSPPYVRFAWHVSCYRDWETLRGVIFDRGIYGHFPIYRMFTFWICVEHLLYSLVVSCLNLDHKHFEAETTSCCILLVYLGPTVMDVEVTEGDCNNKNNTTRNNFALIEKCATPVIRTYRSIRCLEKIVK